ncbi:MAG: histidine phosphatase family protein [Chloroflexaceae bacterium]|nr:histidine phosphatase family protein [Chloroflexaceae bacterium]
MSYEDATTRLILVRHAESTANVERRVQGSGDDPLTPRGEEQARRLARRMSFDHPDADLLFSSPLTRAHQTASFVSAALGLEIQWRSGLEEIRLGRLEGADQATLAAAVHANRLAEYDAETLHDFAERALGTLYGLVAVNPGRTIIVITHLGVISTALAHWVDRDLVRAWGYGDSLSNAAMSEFIFADQVRLLRQNDAIHLE